jgi:outer membrane protein TolC
MKNKNKILIILGLITASIQAQNLDDYIQIAIANAPEIKAANYKVKQAEVKETGAVSYKNTRLNFGVYIWQPQTRVGNQVFTTSVSQELPWFGTLKKKKEWLTAETRLSTIDVDLAKRQIAYQVKELFYKMYEKNKAVEILKDNKQILKSYEDMAMAALSNNRATMNDVIKIRIQKNQLHARIFMYLNDLEVLKADFNRLLQRQISAPVNLPQDIDLSAVLVKQATVESHPTLEKLQQQQAVLDKQSQFVKKDGQPKIILGLNYTNVKARLNFNDSFNGHDILMPQVGLTIPIFNKKYKTEIKRLQWQKAQVEEDRLAQKRNLENALAEAKNAFENQTILLLAAEKNERETQRAINISLKAYETGILDYDNILRLQLQKLNFSLKQIEAVKNAMLAKAKMDYLSGKK